MDIREMSEQDKKILQSRLQERRLFLNMTYQELADKTGISKSTLQRYETGGIQNLPYDKIFALSAALEVRPEYFTDLTKDYTDRHILQQPHLSQRGRDEYFEQLQKFEREALERITPSLIMDGYRVERQNRGSMGDLVATKGSEIWHLDFVYTRHTPERPIQLGLQSHQLFLRLGRLAVYNKPITKYSFVLQDRLIAEQLIRRYTPIHIALEISILVLNETGYEELYFLSSVN